MFEKIILGRTACYGNCPVYTVVVDKYGDIQYTGEEFVYKIGQYNWKISQKKVIRLIKLLDDFNYKKFIYNPGDVFATDHPSCITTVTFDNGDEKVIDHYLGYFHVDERLEKFERALERIIGVKKYVNPNMFIFHFKYLRTNKSYNRYNGHLIVAPNENDAIETIKKYKDRSFIKKQWDIERIGRVLGDRLYCDIVMSERIETQYKE